MKFAFLCATGAVIFLLMVVWCMTQIHFRIGSRHLKVLLFGLTIRRVALTDIAYVSKREPKGFAERWYSTLKTSHRLLTIERKRGIIKRFCITPQNRYVFLADLKSAIRRVDPAAEWATLRAGEEDRAKLPGSEQQPASTDSGDSSEESTVPHSAPSAVNPD